MVGQIIFKEIRRLFNFNQFKDYEKKRVFTAEEKQGRKSQALKMH